MTDQIDRIIDIAKAYNREEARTLIAAELTPKPMTAIDKLRNADIPLQDAGTITGLNGKQATIYRGPPGSEPPESFAPEQIRKELDDLNKTSDAYLKQFRT